MLFYTCKKNCDLRAFCLQDCNMLFLLMNKNGKSAVHFMAGSFRKVPDLLIMRAFAFFRFEK